MTELEQMKTVLRLVKEVGGHMASFMSFDEVANIEIMIQRAIDIEESGLVAGSISKDYKTALYLYEATGDGENSILIIGIEAVKKYMLKDHWFGDDDPPDHVLETIASLDDPDEWGGDYQNWHVNYEDGRIAITRVTHGIESLTKLEAGKWAHTFASVTLAQSATQKKLPLSQRLNTGKNP